MAADTLRPVVNNEEYQETTETAMTKTADAVDVTNAKSDKTGVENKPISSVIISEMITPLNDGIDKSKLDNNNNILASREDVIKSSESSKSSKRQQPKSTLKVELATAASDVEEISANVRITSIEQSNIEQSEDAPANTAAGSSNVTSSTSLKVSAEKKSITKSAVEQKVNLIELKESQIVNDTIKAINKAATASCDLANALKKITETSEKVNLVVKAANVGKIAADFVPKLKDMFSKGKKIKDIRISFPLKIMEIHTWFPDLDKSVNKLVFDLGDDFENFPAGVAVANLISARSELKEVQKW